MSKVDLVLQGKGGVGKSVIAALITQRARDKGETVLAFDTDPVNATFCGYKALGATHLDIMDGEDINARRFDELIESIASGDADRVVIDNGASSFVALGSYLKSNDVIGVLTGMGHEVRIHTVVTGGQALKDTVLGFDAVVKSFKDTEAKIIVWVNEFQGKPIVDGKSFDEMKVFKNNEEFVHAVITIPMQKKETFATDMEEMLTAKLTFDEAINSDSFKLMAKQRLKMIKQEIYANMEAAV